MIRRKQQQSSGQKKRQPHVQLPQFVSQRRKQLISFYRGYRETNWLVYADMNRTIPAKPLSETEIAEVNLATTHITDRLLISGAGLGTFNCRYFTKFYYTGFRINGETRNGFELADQSFFIEMVYGKYELGDLIKIRDNLSNLLKSAARFTTRKCYHLDGNRYNLGVEYKALLTIHEFICRISIADRCIERNQIGQSTALYHKTYATLSILESKLKNSSFESYFENLKTIICDRYQRFFWSDIRKDRSHIHEVNQAIITNDEHASDSSSPTSSDNIEPYLPAITTTRPTRAITNPRTSIFSKSPLPRIPQNTINGGEKQRRSTPLLWSNTQQKREVATQTSTVSQGVEPRKFFTPCYNKGRPQCQQQHNRGAQRNIWGHHLHTPLENGM